MTRRILVDGEPVDTNGGSDVSVEAVEPGIWTVLVNGKSFRVCLDGTSAWVGDRQFAVQIDDPRELSAEAAAGGAGGRREVKAPMPGRVIRVLVAEGDEVAAGQGLVVVEAMKMQNEMPAPKAGRVVAVGVKAGDAVVNGQLLAAIE